MNSSAKGMLNERRCKQTLEAADYRVERRVRGRFTHDFFGLYDIIAFHPIEGWRLIQVTTNVNKPPAFRKLIENHLVPPGTSKEIWIYKDRIKEPVTHILDKKSEV